MACSEDRSLQQYVKKKGGKEWEMYPDLAGYRGFFCQQQTQLVLGDQGTFSLAGYPPSCLFPDPIYALTPSVHELSTMNFEDQWVLGRHYMGTKMVPWDCLSQSKGNHRPSAQHGLSRRFSE